MPAVDMNQTQVSFLNSYLGANLTSGSENAPDLPVVSLVDLQKARLAYDAARKSVRKDLQGLEAAIGAVFKGQVDHSEMVAAAKRVHVILDLVDERLLDRLDDALNAADPKERAKHHRDAVKIIGEYSGILDTNPLIAALANNPFKPVSVEATLRKTLTALSAKLG